MVSQLITTMEYCYAVRKGRHVNNCIFLSWDDAKVNIEGFAGATHKKFECLDDAAAYTRMSLSSSCEQPPQQPQPQSQHPQLREDNNDDDDDDDYGSDTTDYDDDNSLSLEDFESKKRMKRIAICREIINDQSIRVDAVVGKQQPQHDDDDDHDGISASASINHKAKKTLSETNRQDNDSNSDDDDHDNDDDDDDDNDDDDDDPSDLLPLSSLKRSFRNSTAACNNTIPLTNRPKKSSSSSSKSNTTTYQSANAMDKDTSTSSRTTSTCHNPATMNKTTNDKIKGVSNDKGVVANDSFVAVYTCEQHPKKGTTSSIVTTKTTTGLQPSSPLPAAKETQSSTSTTTTSIQKATPSKQKQPTPKPKQTPYPPKTEKGTTSSKITSKTTTELQPPPSPPTVALAVAKRTQSATSTTTHPIQKATPPKQTPSPPKTETFEIDGHIMRKRKPSKAWLTMHQRLKQYKHLTGTFRVNLKNEEDAVLRRWISEQQHQYKCYRLGKRHFTSEQKIQLLSDIGFEFTYQSWDTRMGQARRFREIHGSCRSLPVENPVLGKWMEVQKKQLGLFRKGKICKLTQVQADQLAQLWIDNDGGLGGNEPLSLSRHSHRPETEEKVRKWEEMFGKLKEYKETFQHCNVSKSELQYIDLYKWNCGQRLEYKKLKDGHNCRMTARKLQQLNDIGFSFNPRSRYHKWEERMQQLRQFKQENGHLRVPVTNPELGEFVARQRMEYAKYTDGDTSVCMDKERAQELADLGFVFQAGKRRALDQRKPRKTWDERFDELMQFKDTHRHTLVPQSSMGLGEWVHKQRKNYKKLKAGKPSPLSTERVLKLADVGFVFDASGYRRGRKITENTLPSGASSSSKHVVIPVPTPPPYRPTMI